LVAARHLHHYGYTPTIFYPKRTKAAIFTGLITQLHNLHVSFTDDFNSALQSADLILDSLFGFSFHPPVRAPFDAVITAMIESHVPVMAVDIPSCWDVETGPPPRGQLGNDFMPDYLISLTAAKPCVQFFRGKKHFLGGRFLAKDLADKYGIDVPDYQGIDQVAEVPVDVKVERL